MEAALVAERAGATLVPTAADAWSAEMVIRAKEPQHDEYKFLRPDLVLFTYLHLAAEPALPQRLRESRTCGIASETGEVGRCRPLLEPMREIAGRMSTIVGAHYLSKAQGGKGVLLGGVPGVLPGNVLVRGGGRVSDESFLIRTKALMEQGAAGIVYGRNVNQHPNPRGITRALMAMVHDNAGVKKALAMT